MSFSTEKSRLQFTLDTVYQYVAWLGLFFMLLYSIGFNPLP